MSVVFFTGFPGFLGRALLPRILKRNDHRAICLVQARHLHQARLARTEIERVHGLQDRIDLVTGDITVPGLGVDVERITPEVVEVYHLAAIYDLAVGRELAWLVNIDGTRHMLDFCERSPHLRRLHYMSTCYVSGRWPGAFGENDLTLDQAFNNFYEETKHFAEVEVRRRWNRIPTTIYRPSIVVGDSATGATQKYDGPYFAIRFILKQRGRFAFMPVVGDPNEARLNLVPRDFVIDAITELSGRMDNAGVCYQLADPSPFSVAAFTNLIEEAAGKRLLRVRLPHRFAKSVIERVPGARKVFELPPQLLDYLDLPTTYLTTNAQRDLAGTGVRCPPVDTYLPRLVEYVREHPTVASAAMV